MGTSWYQFPPELLDKILCEFTPHEFLQLYSRSEGRVKEILREPCRLSAVLKNRLEDEFLAFEWDLVHPSSVDAFAVQLETHRQKALEIVDSSVKLSHCDQSEDPQHETKFHSLTQAIRDMGCGANHHVYTVLEHKRLENTFLLNLNDLGSLEPVRIDVSHRAWLKYLLHFHQFSCCVRFFQGCDPHSHENLERAFFELSRCHLEFSTLAHHRLLKSNTIRRELAKLNAFYSGKIYFNSTVAYHNYLRTAVFIILKKLSPTHLGAPVDGNLLKYYKGETQATRVLCMATIAKFLQEEVFEKFLLVTPESSLKDTQVKVSSHFLIVNDTYISVSQEDMSVSVYSRRQVEGTHSKLQMKPLRIIDVVESAFNSETSAVPISLEDLQNADASYWSVEKLGTSKERLRFLRTLVVSICRQDGESFANFRPLITNHDFYYYYVGASYILNIPVASFDYNFVAAPTTMRKSREPVSHRIVYNPRSEYLGVVLMTHDNTSAFGVARQGFFQVLTFDSIESSVALEENLQAIEVAQFPNTLASFLTWLTCSEGIGYACRYCFNVLTVKEGRLECSNAEGVF